MLAAICQPRGQSEEGAKGRRRPGGVVGRSNSREKGEGVAWNEGRKKGEREEGHTTRNVSLRPNMPRIPRVRRSETAKGKDQTKNTLEAGALAR